MSLDLKNLRSKSRLSQSEVARRIGATQSQVSRWEDNPDDMPYSSLRKYLAAVGVSQVLLTNDLAVAPPLDVGDPYVDLRQRINLLLAYLDHASFDVRDDIDRQFTPKSFRNEVLRMNRKPTITLTGRFDSGKSRLANTLLGQNILLKLRSQRVHRRFVHDEVSLVVVIDHYYLVLVAVEYHRAFELRPVLIKIHAQVLVLYLTLYLTDRCRTHLFLLHHE